VRAGSSNRSSGGETSSQKHLETCPSRTISGSSTVGGGTLLQKGQMLSRGKEEGRGGLRSTCRRCVTVRGETCLLTKRVRGTNTVFLCNGALAVQLRRKNSRERDAGGGFHKLGTPNDHGRKCCIRCPTSSERLPESDRYRWASRARAGAQKARKKRGRTERPMYSCFGVGNGGPPTRLARRSNCYST